MAHTITVTEVSDETYRPMFAREDVRLLVAEVKVDGSYLTMTRRADDELKDDEWVIDNYFGADGMPHWSHGAGDRTCAKRKMMPGFGELADDICEAIRKAMVEEGIEA